MKEALDSTDVNEFSFVSITMHKTQWALVVSFQFPKFSVVSKTQNSKGTHLMSSEELFKSIEMVGRKLTLEQLSDCRKAFDLYDDDNDGIITTKDLVGTMRALGYNPNSVILDRIKTIDALSEYSQGRLKYGDFIDLVCQQFRYSFTSDDIL